MPQYRTDLVGSLARQLAFAPAEVRHAQLAAAETLLDDLDPAKSYPAEFVVYRVTGYHPRSRLNDGQPTGLALQHDLCLMIEQASASLRVSSRAAGEPVLSIDDVTERFNVTSKTIQRWRRKGLVSRRFIFADGKLRVGFLLSSIERFIRRNADAVVDGGANLTQVGLDETAAIVRHARRLAVRSRCSVDEITRRVGRRFHRSALTVLHTLKWHDDQQPATAVLPLAAIPLSTVKRARILRRFRRGMSLAKIARRAKRSRSACYRAIIDDRVDRFTKRTVRFHDDELYHGPDAEDAIEQIVRAANSASFTKSANATLEQRPPRNLPPYLADLYRTPLLTPTQERALFLALGYRKFAFVTARRQLDPERARKRQLDALDRLARRAAEVKNQIVRANLRLVVSVARKHLPASAFDTGRGAAVSPTLMELVSEGNLILMRAVDGFDVHRGVRFSTYATLALMKGFARLVPMLRNKARGTNLDTERLAEVADDRHAVDFAHLANRDEVARLMNVLSHEERRVIATYYGLEHSTRLAPATADASYAELGRTLGLSKHHVRQIERTAMSKLRAAAIAN